MGILFIESFLLQSTREIENGYSHIICVETRAPTRLYIEDRMRKGGSVGESLDNKNAGKTCSKLAIAGKRKKPSFL